MQSYPLFRKENIPAYLTVLIAWGIISCCNAVLLKTMNASLSFLLSLFWSALAVMSGMAIMFIASILNLRKLTAGFRRLAEGQTDPQIPPVWCPVLTAATRAAVELVQRRSGATGGITDR
ncbi:hypothetical protein [uncultured Chloroflexus sp.]|uniref:hypothetical protein n=1 Tax=uncultured Chloroflexus sp. TaxID=214040 RepID=UPI00260F856C|nr:hypothetical protein [uncultured Chloroflexus sp.]